MNRFGYVLCCLTSLFTICQLYRGGQFLLVEETIDLSQVTETLIT